MRTAIAKLLVLFFVFLMIAPRLLTTISDSPKTIRVEQGSSTIQEAINNANPGDTIAVEAGMYYEHVIVNKTVSLIGESKENTIIDGNRSGTVVEITADGVSISRFRLQNSGYGWDRLGISVLYADNCEIRDNNLFLDCHNIRLNFSQNSRVIDNTIYGIMTQPTMYGIRVHNAINCSVVGNQVSDCVGAIHLENATDCEVKGNRLLNNNQGIRLYSPCTYNRFLENNVGNNTYDGMITRMPSNTTLVSNSFYHNSFINNTYTFIYDLSGNYWDDGYPSGGNYWSRHNSTDLYSGQFQNLTGNDGIADTPYTFAQSADMDKYPLMHPYGSVRNLQTNLTYLTIQSAVNDPGTLAGHTLLVRNGTYKEQVVVNKTLSLLGESQKATIIDGGGSGTVLTVKAENVRVANFTICNSGLASPPYGNDCGIILDHCNGTILSQNVITENRIGIYLYFSTRNTIEDNNVFSNRENGVWLWYSGSNMLSGNRISENTYNFGVFGTNFSDFNNTIDQSNTVDERPVKYVVGSSNEILEKADVGVLYLINCVNMTARHLDLNGNGHGIFCYNVTNSQIENVAASKSNYGIYFQNCANDSVENCDCFENWVGVCIQESNQITASNNTFSNSEKGISFYEADNNTIEGNTIRSNLYGIRMFSSDSNMIFHNNLVGNTEQASLITSYQNSWNNSIEGNYWSDNVSYDVNRDGLGDSQYQVDVENSDYHPLQGQYHNFSLVGVSRIFHIAVISNSTITATDFDSSSRTIQLTVNGSDSTLGFCRVRIPHELLQPELIFVTVDGDVAKVLWANYSLRDDGLDSWIYFAYAHSAHEIVIVNELRSSVMFLLPAAIALACFFAKKLEKLQCNSRTS